MLKASFSARPNARFSGAIFAGEWEINLIEVRWRNGRSKTGEIGMPSLLPLSEDIISEFLERSAASWRPIFAVRGGIVTQPLGGPR